MPKVFKGERRTADIFGNVDKVMRIATGEQTHGLAFDGKNAAVVR